MKSPRPRPCWLRRTAPLKKGWNSCARAAGGIGTPPSATDRTNLPPTACASTSIGTPGAPCVTALAIRFEASCPSLPGSQSTGSSIEKWVMIWRSGAIVRISPTTCSRTGARGCAAWRVSVSPSPSLPRAKSRTFSTSAGAAAAADAAGTHRPPLHQSASTHPGGFYAWEFRKGGRELKVRVQGRAVFNALALMQDKALEGLGLAYLPEDRVEALMRKGRSYAFSRIGIRRVRGITPTTRAAAAIANAIFHATGASANCQSPGQAPLR